MWYCNELLTLAVGPYIVRGIRLYVQFMRGNLMRADSNIATGLPYDLKFIELHRVIVRSLWWVTTSWGCTLFVAAYFACSTLAALALYFTNSGEYGALWCADPRYAIHIVTLLGSSNLFVVPTILLIASTKAKDAFSIRSELSTFLAIAAVLSLFCVLAIFPVIPVAQQIFLFTATWGALVLSLVMPVLQSYAYEHNQELFRNKSGLKGKAGTIKKPGHHDEAIALKQLNSTAEPDVSRFRPTLSFLPRSLGLFLMRSKLAQVGMGPVITVDSNSTEENTTATKTSTELSTVLSINGTEDTIEVTRTTSPPPNPKDKHGNIHLSDLLRDPHECDRLQELAVHCFSVEVPQIKKK